MYETKGAQRVAINQLGPATVRPSPNASAPRRSAFDLSHRRPRASASDEVKRRYRENLLEQPPPCIIFH